MSARKQWKVWIDIPQKYTPTYREAIGEEIIDFIRERSDKGLDKNNKPFPKYTQSYTKSLDFRVSGKSKSKVNLKLSGDMLAALHVLKHEPGRILIGYEKGQENDKAEGNIIGSYGQSTGNPKKARDFLGIKPEDLTKKILKKFPISDTNEEILRFAKEGKEKELKRLETEDKENKVFVKFARKLYNE